jgi:hypothetical protein
MEGICGMSEMPPLPHPFQVYRPWNVTWQLSLLGYHFAINPTCDFSIENPVGPYWLIRVIRLTIQRLLQNMFQINVCCLGATNTDTWNWFMRWKTSVLIRMSDGRLLKWSVLLTLYSRAHCTYLDTLKNNYQRPHNVAYFLFSLRTFELRLLASSYLKLSNIQFKRS